jgi:hypothetical protein
MQNVPSELVAAYVAIIRAAPDEAAAAQHLAAFIADAAAIVSQIQAAIDAARQRAAQ